MPDATESTPGPGPPSQPGWRDVTLTRYRVYTTLSSLIGVLLLAWGFWRLAHAQIASGILLAGLGFVLGLWTTVLRIEGAPGALYEPRRSGREHWAPRVLHFYTRRECMLCDEARARLESVLQEMGITLVAHDVDEDDVLKKRYGARVPVAVYRGDEVFALRYDEAAVRMLR